MDRNKKLAVIGLGYVGLPLAVEFSKIMFVTGFDLSTTRINELNEGYDKTYEVGEDELKEIKNNLYLSSNLNDLKNCVIYIITVPTPIDSDNKPDLRPLVRASEMVASILKPGDLVVYESTVYPGCTEEICLPILEKNSRISRDLFYVGYSPERINPGDKSRKLSEIVKVTSGNSPEAKKIVDDLYKKIITAGTHSAPSIKVAEAAKVIENTQRDLNIALINELAMLFANLGIDTQDVLKAAETKWNFIPFRPGLVGGHCIGVDPYYLTYKAQQVGFDPQVILSGRNVNDNMGKYVANILLKELTKRYHFQNNFNILILGLTFKENCPDIRNTRVIDIFNELNSRDCEVDIADPIAYINEAMQVYNIKLIGGKEVYINLNTNNLDIAEKFYEMLPKKKYHGIIIAVSHKQFYQISISQIRKLGIDNDCIIFDLKHVFTKNDSDLRL